jgi:hypothetical protein
MYAYLSPQEFPLNRQDHAIQSTPSVPFYKIGHNGKYDMMHMTLIYDTNLYNA